MQGTGSPGGLIGEVACWQGPRKLDQGPGNSGSTRPTGSPSGHPWGILPPQREGLSHPQLRGCPAWWQLSPWIWGRQGRLHGKQNQTPRHFCLQQLPAAGRTSDTSQKGADMPEEQCKVSGAGRRLGVSGMAAPPHPCPTLCAAPGSCQPLPGQCQVSC